MSAITRILPRVSLSQWVGKIVHWQGPKIWADLTKKLFVFYYKINMTEAEYSIDHYKSVGELFVRRLNAEARPVASATVLHPADSRLTQWGELIEGQLIQAKGHLYSGFSFVQDSELYEKIKSGLFLTYYLCPTDYHRVHSPVEGVIKKVIHIPGDLWPVNQWSTENIDEVFNLNERIVLEIETQWGFVALVFVGATNVGSIRLSFDGSFVGNSKLNEVRKHIYPEGLQIQKGDELGYFAMGSTVVMIYPEEFKKRFSNQLQGLGQSVHVKGALVL